MNNPFERMLRRINFDPLVVDQRQLTADCDALWDWFLSHGLLEMTVPKQGSLCPDCWELGSVVCLPPVSPKEESTFYVSCEECGPSRIPIEQIQQWIFDIPGFLATILRDVPRAGMSGMIHENRWWRLGRVRWAGSQWNLYFARDDRRGREPLQIDLPPRSVVLVPRLPLLGGEMHSKPVAMLPLDQLLTWDGTDLLFDQEFAEDQLAAVQLPDRKSQRKSLPTKAGERQAKIKVLERALTEHLISARDYAVTTRDRTGAAQLLKRPTIAWLSKEVGFSESTVWRCLQNAKQERLGQLWELAGDVERILHFHDRCF